VQRPRVGPQRLLLGNLRALTQPPRPAASRREQSGQTAQRRRMTRFLLVNGSFHRNWHRCYWASSASPAVARRGRRQAAGATQRFFHAVNVQLGCDTLYRSKPYSGVWTRADHRTASPTAARSTSRGARSTGARSWLATSTPASRRSSGRCAPARMLRSSRWRPCPTASTSRWSATRSMESTGLSKLIRSFRRLLRQEFGTLRWRLPTLWTNSYFVATVGDSTLEDVKGHVQNQRDVSATPLASQG
jgi:hypothetical protein